MERMLFDFMLKSRNLFFLPVRQEATHLPHSCHSLSADLLTLLLASLSSLNCLLPDIYGILSTIGCVHMSRICVSAPLVKGKFTLATINSKRFNKKENDNNNLGLVMILLRIFHNHGMVVACRIAWLATGIVDRIYFKRL